MAEEIISTAVAIDKDKNSQYAVKWAVDNLTLNNNMIILVHVRPQSFQSYADKNQLFLPFRGFCARKGIRAKEVVLHDQDVANTLVEYIDHNCITTFVLGASSRSALSRAFKTVDIIGSLSRYAPDSCTVYSVSKTKVQKLKTASIPATPGSSRTSWQSSHSGIFPDTPSSADFQRQSSWRSTISEDKSRDGLHMVPPASNKNHSPFNSMGSSMMTPIERLFGSKTPPPQPSPENSSESLPIPSQRHHNRKDLLPQKPGNNSYEQIISHPGVPYPTSGHSGNNLNHFLHTKPHSASHSSDFSALSSFTSSDMSFENLDNGVISYASASSTSSFGMGDVEEELRKLKLELQQIQERYNAACTEPITVREKVRNIDPRMPEEARKLEEAKYLEEYTMAMVEREKQKCKAAVELAQKAQRIAQLETDKRRIAEKMFEHEAEEKKKAMDALTRMEIRYRMYSIEDIETATNNFSNSEKIGEGGYGPVYKGYLDHTAVAIKVLRSDISQGQKQFQREIEVLSRMRHPNMVILLGACPEYGCLVYEYMDNGSLEDRLLCRNGTPSIPWRERFRIAAEIATALHFLHQTRPDPLVHRDLKPANILLDRNYVTKISDVGLSRLVPASVADNVTQYHMTAAAGTFCYIDPEYQQTGQLGTKSDIYSLGVMLLQIITAKPPMGLTHQVEGAIERGQFADILDPTVTDWPVEEALSFAKMALRCAELRKRDRPDLGSVILPELERLRDLGSETKAQSRLHHVNPQHQLSQESLSFGQETGSSI